MTSFSLLILLVICHDDASVNSQIESPRGFIVYLTQNDMIKSKIMKDLINKQRLVEQEKREESKREEERLENLRRKTILEHLVKKLSGKAAVLYDFYSRF